MLLGGDLVPGGDGGLVCEAVEDAEGEGAPAKDLRREALEVCPRLLGSFIIDAREAGRRSVRGSGLRSRR